MKALLLAAGFGTRLRPVTNNLPKCLVPINKKPLLDYWLHLLFDQGIAHALINTHFLSEQVEKYVDQSPWKNELTLLHETQLLGTGGTILRNKENLDQEAFLVAHADNLTWFDLSAFQEQHTRNVKEHDAIMTMMTFHTDSPESCGIVEIDAKGFVLKSIW